MVSHSRSKLYFNKRLDRWKVNTKKGKKKSEVDKHFAGNLGVLGRLTKGNAYAKNGYFQMESEPERKKVYERSGNKKTDYSSDNNNFINLKNPYPMQAHHILPKASFSEKQGFKEEQRKLLLRVPYDINHGENIIFLPEEESDCKVHCLPSHYGGHPKYIDIVGQEISSIRDKLKEKKKSPCKEKGPQMDILADLIDCQEDNWIFLAWSYKRYGTGSVETQTLSYMNEYSLAGGV